MPSPCTVWTLVARDEAGQPLGFETGRGHVHFQQSAAYEELASMGELAAGYAVVECVLMGAARFQKLVNSARR